MTSLINQSFSDFEIIIVDDGSKDGTEKMMKRFKSKPTLRFLHQKNEGPAVARNRGIGAARGRIIAFTDDDCQPSPDWVESIVRSMHGADGIEGKTTSPWSGKLTPFTRLNRNERGGHFSTCNIAYKRDVLEDIGGFYEEFDKPYREDSDLAFSVIEKGYKIKFDKHVVVEHPAYRQNFKSFLKERLKYDMDPLLFKRHPELFKRHMVPIPSGHFTPFYVLLSVVFTIGLLFHPSLAFVGLMGLLFVAVAEIWKKSLKTTVPEFFKFFVGRIVGSYLILYSILKGCWRFKVNPLKLLRAVMSSIYNESKVEIQKRSSRFFVSSQSKRAC